MLHIRAHCFSRVLVVEVKVFIYLQSVLKEDFTSRHNPLFVAYPHGRSSAYAPDLLRSCNEVPRATTTIGARRFLLALHYNARNAERRTFFKAPLAKRTLFGKNKGGGSDEERLNVAK